MRLFVRCALSLLVAFLLGPAAQSAENRTFVPDFVVKPDDITVLVGADATLPPELKQRHVSEHGKFFLVGWTNESQVISWEITAPEAGDYAVRVLAERKSDQTLQVEVATGTQTLRGEIATNGWQRMELPEVLHLAKGKTSVSFRMRSTDQKPYKAFFHAVELVRPEVRDRLHQQAVAQRSDTTWFQKARYGIFVHWTWQTKPRTGEPKPYAQAVADFDVPGFVAQMKATGAGVVVLTTSHAFQSFPGPNQALDRILPGRTASRDLVGDLADALGKEGIRLMLYYHLGAGGPGNDNQWLDVSGFRETDTTRFWANWQSIVREVGERYGNRLAGWWFDDGTTNYYYRSPRWADLAAAAKAGNPQRIIGFNPWAMPSATEFQDFYCGELNDNPSGVANLLTPEGTGIYPSGMFAGLQASGCLLFDGKDWVHGGKNQEIKKSKYSVERLTAIMRKFIARKNVPLWNLEIYQEGTVSPESVAIFKQVRESL